MSEFILHERLEADGVFIIDWELCRVILMDEVKFPWLILVPRKPGLVELSDLATDEQNRLMAEITQAGQGLKMLFDYDKLNVAALGNQVSQLHVHVIARFKNDACWPQPVWGSPHEAYDEIALAGRVAELKKILGASPGSSGVV